MQTVTFTEPDGFHVHVRDGELMRWVVPHTARRFARAIIMPNLNPPVESTEQARKYRERILGSVPSDVSFEPLMTLYLTEETPPNEIVTAKESGFVHGVKWYPAGATTNSQHGVQFIHEASPRVAGTITAHHLLLNRVAMFEGGLRPHHYCLPILKREEHRVALVEAAASGHPRFFLGTDSSPCKSLVHPKRWNHDVAISVDGCCEHDDISFGPIETQCSVPAPPNDQAWLDRTDTPVRCS